MDCIKSERLQFVTENEKVIGILNYLPKIARTDIAVLITGESGTGKEIVANIIHQQSERSQCPFVAVNCAALPPDLLEAELFGYKKGSFTGATQDRQGLFELADGGTIFLDEIGDMPLHLQAKLLRIIQQRKIRPIGSNSEKFVDFRILSATHKLLNQEIKAGKFREDLYYRLNGVSVHIPSLRERKDDITVLMGYFISRFAKKYSVHAAKFSTPALHILQAYSWPGNVRQLESFIEQMTVLHQDKDLIEASDFVLSENGKSQVHNIEDYFCQQTTLPTLSELTDRYIQYVYGRVRFHQGDAARVLGLSRRTINRKLREYDLMAGLSPEGI